MPQPPSPCDANRAGPAPAFFRPAGGKLGWFPAARVCLAPPPAGADIRHALILKSDRLCAVALQQVVRATFPGVAVAAVARVADAEEHLRRSPCDLLVSGLALPDGNVLDLLAARGAPAWAARPVLVVTSHLRVPVLRKLLGRPHTGVFDAATEDAEDLSFALLGVSLGLPCWSASATERLTIGPRAVPRRSQRLAPAA